MSISKCLQISKSVTEEHRKRVSVRELLETPSVLVAVLSHAGFRAARAFRCAYIAMDSAICRVWPVVVQHTPPAYIYVCGGYDGDEVVASVERFDPRAGDWESMPPMSRRRFRAAAAVLKGMLYMCGGKDQRERITYSAERFDPALGRWESLPPMRIPRSEAAAATVHGLLCVGGGHDGTSALSSVETYDAASQEWTLLQSMWQSRRSPAAVATQRQLYVIGGFDGKIHLNTAETYNFGDRQWMILPRMPEARSSATALRFRQELFVCGGTNGKNFLTCTLNYDVTSGIWHHLTTTEHIRGAAVVGYCGKVYTFGGISGKRVIDSAQRLDLQVQMREDLPALHQSLGGACAAVLGS